MSQQFVEALLFTIIIMFNNGAYKVESGIVKECPPYEEVVPRLEKGLHDNEYRGWHATCQKIAIIVRPKGQPL
tara:strand:- start:1613 stop:1831 length:219 start_codon:yes stop_codon:yes gene_type:complete